jgi:hypothetical protein
MAGITHSAVVVVPDDGTSPVGTDEWNDDHVIDLVQLAADLGIYTPFTNNVVGSGAGNTTTTSTSLTDLTGASITGTTHGGDCIVGFMGSAFHGSANGSLRFGVSVDAADINPYLIEQDSVANIEQNVSFSMLITGLSAASHTFKIRWFVASGTGTVRNSAAANTWHMYVAEQ